MHHTLVCAEEGVTSRMIRNRLDVVDRDPFMLSFRRLCSVCWRFHSELDAGVYSTPYVRATHCKCVHHTLVCTEKGVMFRMVLKEGRWHMKSNVRLPEQGNSNSHGARPVHLIITMT